MRRARASSVVMAIFPSSLFQASSAALTVPRKSHPGNSACKLARALSMLTGEIPTLTSSGVSALSVENTETLSPLPLYRVTGRVN